MPAASTKVFKKKKRTDASPTDRISNPLDAVVEYIRKYNELIDPPKASGGGKGKKSKKAAAKKGAKGSAPALVAAADDEVTAAVAVSVPCPTLEELLGIMGGDSVVAADADANSDSAAILAPFTRDNINSCVDREGYTLLHHVAKWRCGGGGGSVPSSTSDADGDSSPSPSLLAQVVYHLVCVLGADVGARTRYGFTPLHLAVAVGNIPAVPLLVGGADGLSALAAVGAQMGVVGHADDAADGDDGAPSWARVVGRKAGRVLSPAEERGDERVEAEEDAANKTAADSNSSVVNALTSTCTDRCHGTPLHLAMVGGEGSNSALISLLISLGADPTLPNGDGDTPVELALLAEDTPKARALLDAFDAYYGLNRGVIVGGGAITTTGTTAQQPATAPSSSLSPPIVRDGMTSKALIAAKGLAPTSRTPLQLLERRNGDGQTLLHRAVLEEEHAMLRALIDLGAVVNTKDWRSNTTLQIAIYGAASMKTFKMLLKAGANVNAKGWDGTAMHALFNYNTGREALEWIDCVDYSANVPPEDFVSVTVDAIRCPDHHPMVVHYNGRTTGFSCDGCQASMGDGVLSMRCSGDCLYDVCADCLCTHLDMRCGRYDYGTGTNSNSTGGTSDTAAPPHKLVAMDREGTFTCSECTTKTFGPFCGFECKDCAAPSADSSADASPSPSHYHVCMACACLLYNDRASKGLVVQPAGVVGGHLRLYELLPTAANPQLVVTTTAAPADAATAAAAPTTATASVSTATGLTTTTSAISGDPLAFRAMYEHGATLSDLFQQDVPVDWEADYVTMLSLFDLFLEYGGDINARDQTRCTPLHKMATRLETLALTAHPIALRRGLVSRGFLRRTDPLGIVKANLAHDTEVPKSIRQLAEKYPQWFLEGGNGGADDGAPGGGNRDDADDGDDGDDNASNPTQDVELPHSIRQLAERHAQGSGGGADPLAFLDNGGDAGDDEESDEEDEDDDDDIQQVLGDGGAVDDDDDATARSNSDMLGLTSDASPMLFAMAFVDKYKGLLDFGAVDHKGASVVHYAARYASPIALAVLLQAKREAEARLFADGGGCGADMPPSSSSSSSPSSSAASISITAPDSLGRTPLHLLDGRAGVSAYQAALLLISHGAPLEAEDKFGNTPLMMAVRSRVNENDEATAAALAASASSAAMIAQQNSTHQRQQHTAVGGASWLGGGALASLAAGARAGVVPPPPLHLFNSPAFVREHDIALVADWSAGGNHFVLALARLLVGCGAKVQRSTVVKRRRADGSGVEEEEEDPAPANLLQPIHCCNNFLCEAFLLGEGASKIPYPKWTNYNQ